MAPPWRLYTELVDDRVRGSAIEPATFRMLLAYMLLDFDDEYGVRDLGLYDARYGHLSV